MKYVDEFRHPEKVQHWVDAIDKIAVRPWTIMEVCGGQTHAIVKFGLHQLLPPSIRLIHGPGCPVCVTPLEMIDHALEIAARKEVIFCSFGDMLRVPGSSTDLLTLRARGSDVRMIHSPLEALEIAAQNPRRQVVFFGVGFETTAPPNAMAIFQARQRSLCNFSVLCSHVLVPPALSFLGLAEGCQVQGFLAAGHVCTVSGYAQYHPLAKQLKMPIVITGFEPLDILQGLYFCIELLERNECAVLNQYERAVHEIGNMAAQHIVDEIFEVVDCNWRGIGMIAKSGLGIKKAYADLDAAARFPKHTKTALVDTGCWSGLILQGKKKPHDCPLFGKEFTRETPMGAPMVSTEGACSAYYAPLRFPTRS